MRRAAVWPVAFGLWLGVLTAAQGLFAPKLIQLAIPLVATGACLAAALVLWVRDAYRSPLERPRMITDSSFATVAFVIGVALALLGAGFGLWLILIGVGIGTVGLAGVLREQRARARAVRGKSAP